MRSQRGSVSPRGLAVALPQSPAPYSLTANTREAYRDLLIFEERLKQNSQRLASQRRKYEAFLISLILSIAFLAYRVVLVPSPYTLIQFTNSGLLLVGLVTLVLFFATGVYSEKIAYAYKFVPQANRALRYYNIYLNTKKPPRSWSLNPFRRQKDPAATAALSPGAPGLARSGSSTTVSRASKTPPSPTNAPTGLRSRSPYGTTRQAAVPLAPLPPASNPRGELIFSSKVTPAYCEGYEKYRSDWEKKRRPGREEVSWTKKALSLIGIQRNASPAASSSSSQKGESASKKTSDRHGAISYAASPSEQSDSSMNVADDPAPTARGRDARARPLVRSHSNTSVSSSMFSVSPPASRSTSPLRDAQAIPVMRKSMLPASPGSGQPRSDTSSRASTPDLIREDDEYLSYYPHNGHMHMSASAQSLALARRRQNLTSTSESSLASARLYSRNPVVDDDDEDGSVLQSPPDTSPPSRTVELEPEDKPFQSIRRYRSSGSSRSLLQDLPEEKTHA